MCLHLAKYSNSSSIVQNTLKTAYLFVSMSEAEFLFAFKTQRVACTHFKYSHKHKCSLEMFTSKQNKNTVVLFPSLVTTVHVSKCYSLTSPMVSLTYWSIALAISALFTPLRNFMLRTRGWCLSHQLSALSPASRVQWIRDCCPAPIPITWKTQVKKDWGTTEAPLDSFLIYAPPLTCPSLA